MKLILTMLKGILVTGVIYLSLFIVGHIMACLCELAYPLGAKFVVYPMLGFCALILIASVLGVLFVVGSAWETRNYPSDPNDMYGPY